ncbi:MAG: tyrosine--tRNA ligase [Desulfurococcales archaeon]|nr:tyrosine--tRNA ligase [Desulfurococcales archaeon]
MDMEEKYQLITRNAVEVIVSNELREALETGRELKGYIGIEPSGFFHIGWLIWSYKVDDMIRAGVKWRLLEATWHALINDKLGGDIMKIRKAARLIRKVLWAIGVDIEKIEFVDAENLARDKEYWATVIRVAKSNSLARIKRALTIMGRKIEDAEIDSSKLIYPSMQVSDIFYMNLDIALGGMDQRKAHMLARDTALKLGYKKPISIHTPLLTGLQGLGRMDPSKVSEEEHAIEFKMSKSKPESSIFIHDQPEDIRRKLKKAYCPPRQEAFNPVLEISRYVLFNRGDFNLVVERPEKYGGTVVYEGYDKLLKDYLEGKLHPADLKKATAEALIDLLTPIRVRLLSDKEAVRLINELSSVKITR